MTDDFRPPFFLRNPHLQTVCGRFMRSRRLVAYHRERLITPDGDELWLDHAGESTGRRVVLLHGLEGSSYSVYIQGLASLLLARGFAVTAMNFRSCARDPRDIRKSIPNLRPRLYHSGETSDFDFVARTLHARGGESLYAFGASLGGNVLLKWLGEHPEDRLITAAATVSVPYDLAAGAKHLETFMGGLYVASFRRTLMRKAARIVELFPETQAILDLDRIRRARTFREFDDAATAPLHGFRDADDYYERSSSIAFLSRITVRTLMISSDDDPFLPAGTLGRVRIEAAEDTRFVTTRRGGHVGFVALGDSSIFPWAEHVIAEWLERTHLCLGEG